jgi:hypothetical protein
VTFCDSYIYSLSVLSLQVLFEHRFWRRTCVSARACTEGCHLAKQEPLGSLCTPGDWAVNRLQILPSAKTMVHHPFFPPGHQKHLQTSQQELRPKLQTLWGAASP